MIVSLGGHDVDLTNPRDVAELLNTIESAFRQIIDLKSIAPGTAGQHLVNDGADKVPKWTSSIFALIDAKGDLIVGTADNTAARLAVGTNGFVLTADSTQAGGIKWATPVDTLPAGAMLDFGGTAAPTGYLACDGSNVSRSTYAALFTAIGTTWGVGNGTTTFGLPDFRRRTAVGSGGSGTATLANSVGSTGGEETHTMTTSELVAHTHNIYAYPSTSDGPFISASGGRDTYRGATTESTGSSTPFNVIQPSAVVLKIIKT